MNLCLDRVERWPATLIARWYCPRGHCTISLLPDCLASPPLPPSGSQRGVVRVIGRLFQHRHPVPRPKNFNLQFGARLRILGTHQTQGQRFLQAEPVATGRGPTDQLASLVQALRATRIGVTDSMYFQGNETVFKAALLPALQRLLSNKVAVLLRRK